MKTIQLLILILCSTVGFSQQSFFEAIEAHGEDAVYQRYYSVYKDDDGKQKIAGKQYQLKVEILKTEGVYSGVKLVGSTKDDKAGMLTIDATKSKSSKIIGYPNVSHLVDKVSRKGLVVIDDYIIKMGSVWKEKDGLGFNDIDEIFIRVGASGNESNKDEGKKKKKKFGSIMGELKDAAMNNTASECSSPACKKAESMDLKKYVLEYLEAMKAKQNSYTLTAKDKADIALIEGAVDGYYKHVDEKNDAFWKSEEGQAIIRNRQNQEAFDSKNTVKLTNNTGKEIYVGNSNQSITIYDGSTGDWDCERDAYILIKIDGSNYEPTSNLVYKAHTSCGGSKVIN